MRSFPTLTQGGQCSYNTSRSISYPCQLVRYTTGAEQRWAAQPERATAFSIELTDISGYDLSNIRAFYISNVGPLNNTWDITLDGVDYTSLAFEADGFAPTLSSLPERWNLSLKVRQTS